MIIDIILDRKNHKYYDYNSFKDIYDYATNFGFNKLASACDCGNNKDVATQLVEYLKNNDYVSDNEESKKLINWVKRQKWVLEKQEPIASDGYVGIFSLDCMNDKIKTTLSKKWLKLHYNTKGEAYFKSKGSRYYLKDFVLFDLEV